MKHVILPVHVHCRYGFLLPFFRVMLWPEAKQQCQGLFLKSNLLLKGLLVFHSFVVLTLKEKCFSPLNYLTRSFPSFREKLSPFQSMPKIPRTPDLVNKHNPRTSSPPPLGRSVSPTRPSSKNSKLAGLHYFILNIWHTNTITLPDTTIINSYSPKWKWIVVDKYPLHWHWGE